MNTRLFTLITACGLMLLAGCAKHETAREIDWAKAALARNPAYEVLATDATAGVFTVRDTATGTVQTLRLEDLVAAPRPVKATAQSAPAPAAAPAETPAAPGESAEPADSLATAQTTDVTDVDRAAPGQALAEGPGYRITRGEPAAPQAAPATLEGPGYSIERQDPAKGSAAPEAEQVASDVERRTDPIICQGDRLMRIDGGTIEFTGDAVIAEKGCDLYISNASIRAGGVGIIARQARVHIVNSSIGGTRGSYEASDGAQIYVARSTFTGVGRRFDTASMNDLGGNSYETH
jgi:hypothetical protein